MALKKILVFLMILLIIWACDTFNDTMLFHRYILTVDTDVDSLNISNVILSKNTSYPYTLFNLYQNELLSSIVTVYPVSDTGKIHFNLYGGEGYDNIPYTSFLDSLVQYTPIDTTIVVFRSGNGIDTIIVNPNK